MPGVFGHGRPVGMVDPFGPSPAAAYIRKILPGATFTGPEPTMFKSGDLPLVTGSGVDPQVLRSVHWRLRHSAAVTASRAAVLKMVEQSDDELNRDRLMHRDGRAMLGEYLERVQEWARTAPADITETEADAFIASSFPPIGN
jgi:hypothetical protein